MTVRFTRAGNTVTASDDATSRTMRSQECRNVAGAIELEMKINADPAFAMWWVRGGDPKSPDVKRTR